MVMCVYHAGMVTIVCIYSYIIIRIAYLAPVIAMCTGWGPAANPP